MQGDIVACIDGDSYASPKWLEKIAVPLIENQKVAITAGYVVVENTLWSRITSFWQFVILRKILRMRTAQFAWGSNFACRKTDYIKVGGIEPIYTLKQSLGLHFWAEDFYLSRALMKVGSITFVMRAKVFTRLPAWKLNIATAPLREWQEDNKKLLTYFKS